MATNYNHTIVNDRFRSLWRRGPLAGMIVSEAAITISVELVLRHTRLDLAALLVDRSLLALLMLTLLLRPWNGQTRPRSAKLAAVRVITGGLTFLGWFGAIGALSGRVTQPVLWLDALILAFFRSEKHSYERKTIPVLAAALVLFVALALREPGTVTSLPKGILFLLIALGSRAASYKVWERAQGAEEHLYWLIAPALLGGAISGVAIGGWRPQAMSGPLFGALILVALAGLSGYFYMNEVIARVGAFYTRVAEHWQLPLLWAAHLATERAAADWRQGAISLLVCAAAAYTYWPRGRSTITPQRDGIAESS